MNEMNEASSPTAHLEQNSQPHPHIFNSSTPTEHYNRLVAEHQLYAQRLEDLNGKLWLTEAEKLEEVRLKKLKLRLKDEMEALLHSLGDIRPQIVRLPSAASARPLQAQSQA